MIAMLVGEMRAEFAIVVPAETYRELPFDTPNPPVAVVNPAIPSVLPIVTAPENVLVPVPWTVKLAPVTYSVVAPVPVTP